MVGVLCSRCAGSLPSVRIAADLEPAAGPHMVRCGPEIGPGQAEGARARDADGRNGIGGAITPRTTHGRATTGAALQRESKIAC